MCILYASFPRGQEHLEYLRIIDLKLFLRLFQSIFAENHRLFSRTMSKNHILSRTRAKILPHLCNNGPCNEHTWCKTQGMNISPHSITFIICILWLREHSYLLNGPCSSLPHFSVGLFKVHKTLNAQATWLPTSDDVWLEICTKIDIIPTRYFPESIMSPCPTLTS